ncbi:MAG: MarR family transcriptional regulator, partial [Actinomycetota bacterium]|nr:MarR family transcriptional regulator [Actinomycetota bacterium]
MTVEDIDWLVARLQAMVTASPAVWAGRGMTLLQLIALHFISALAPVTLTELAEALGTKPPATSAMVDRLIQAGLVCRTPDPQDRRRI